jgi:diguanylate cyclase (GGDEF)-like protein
MDTKRIITNEDAKEFFNTSLNTIDDAYGKATYYVKTSKISFDFNAVLLLGYNGLYANQLYDLLDPRIDIVFGNHIITNMKSITEKTTFKYAKKINDKDASFEVKMEKTEENNILLHILCFEKLVATEETLSVVSKLIGAGTHMFTGNTWWIDYDYHAHHFYQSDYGPQILGVPLREDKLYSTRKFQQVRNKAKERSRFYDECIEVEKENYEEVRNNKSDYFGGRTPAVTVKDEIVWVEAYGKCLVRYPDGSPRFFIAIDLYLSDISEELNQTNIVNSLTNHGLINSNVGVWYYQKHFKEGRYYFTKSHKSMMKLSVDYDSDNITENLPRHFEEITKVFPEYQMYFDDFLNTHRKIFTGEKDKYSIILPNYIDKDHPKWIEIRGTVIKRDETGDVDLFVGVNVDITESYLREQELVRLRVQNEHLQLAEKLAVKAGNVLVWYQDETLLGDKKYFFGNDSFSKKLGLNRTKDGLVSIQDLVKTLILGTKGEKEIREKIMSSLKNLYKSHTKSGNFYNVLSKHMNFKTKEIYYFSNSVEIEEFDEEGNIKLVGGIMVDVTDNIKREEEIKYLANHDMLSGLHNRNYFETFISSKLPQNYTLCVFDLDGLKLINDAFGHIEGDRVIKIIANTLKDVFKDNLFIARIGGDEFVVLLSSIQENYANELFATFDSKIKAFNVQTAIEINVSRAGIIVTNGSTTFEKAFTTAENRMYKRKLNNRSSRKSKVLDSIIETLNQKTEETKEHSYNYGRIKHD